VVHSALIMLERGLGQCLMLGFPTLSEGMTHADWAHLSEPCRDSRMQGCWIKPSMNHLRLALAGTLVIVGCGRVAAAFRVDPFEDRSRKIFSSELTLGSAHGTD
jgi:hypothetical protein